MLPAKCWMTGKDRPARGTPGQSVPRSALPLEAGDARGKQNKLHASVRTEKSNSPTS